MKQRIRLGRVLLVAAFAAIAVQTAHAGPPAPTVPGTIAVEDGNKPFLVGHAVGVQIYACRATAAGFQWRLVAPRADLFADNGKPIVTHFAGPTWRATDGSEVVGQRVDGVTVEATAIPWLLLSAARTGAGADGDRLAGTTFIQRINTTGGLPPSTAACDEIAVGTAVEIPYTADYVFWKASGS